MNEQPLTAKQLAAKYQIHINTVYNEIRKGHLIATRLPSKRVRITEANEKAWIDSYNKH